MLVGYGNTGTGTTGETDGTAGTKHHGFNTFDATGATLGYSDTMLADDFDDGTAAARRLRADVRHPRYRYEHDDQRQRRHEALGESTPR